ncbi:hypothetical protein LI169_22160, partial [Desulfovibrio desulfuricans]|nr:hypothetical protein [Desulfovibrio desulfuricans]
CILNKYSPSIFRFLSFFRLLKILYFFSYRSIISLDTIQSLRQGFIKGGDYAEKTLLWQQSENV